jgi:chitinase
MTTTKTLCSNCGKGGAPTTVVLTVPVYETTVLPPSTVVHTITQTRTNSAGKDATETLVSISGYIPVTEASQPPYVVVTETVFPTALPPTKEVQTKYITTEYETIGSSGIETATVTITAAVPANGTAVPEIGYDTSTTICTVCGNGTKTITMTIPRVTSTLTFLPTSFATASASAGIPQNSTQNGGDLTYNIPARREAQTEAPTEGVVYSVGGAGKVGAGYGVVLGAVVAVLAVL